MQSLLQNSELIVPARAAGVVFMPGIGGMLHLPAMRHVARHLHDNGFGTLIADLLTPEEQELDLRTRWFRTDIPMLAARVAAIAATPERDLPMAFFGSGLVGSAGLMAVAMGDAEFFAVAIQTPRLGVIRDFVPPVTTPALLFIEEGAAKPAGVLEGEVRVEAATSANEVARKTLVFFRNHVPVTATLAL